MPIRDGEHVEGGLDPGPAAQLAHTGRVGIELLQERVDRRGLVVQGGIDSTLDLPTDLLEQLLVRNQLGCTVAG